MFNVVDNIDQYLYHYTTREVLFEYLLPKMVFRMATFVQTNDPRETKDWNIGIQFEYDNYLEEIASVRNSCEDTNSFFNRKIKPNVKLACFSMDNEKALKPPNHSFGRGFGHSRMWAQYAENHKGVCLIFNKKELVDLFERTFSSSGLLFHGPIEYEDIPHYEISGLSVSHDDLVLDGVSKTLDTHIERFYKSLFFQKNEDWKYEYEYRFLYITGNSDFEFLPLERSMKGICLGVDFPESYIPLVKIARDNIGIRFANLQWYNGSPIATEWP